MPRPDQPTELVTPTRRHSSEPLRCLVRHTFVSCLIGGLSTLGASAALAQDTWARPVAETRTETSDQGDLRQRTQVQIDTRLLANDPERLVVELPDAEPIVLVRRQSQRRGAARLTWWGHVESEADHQARSVTLTLRDGLVVGRIDMHTRTIAIEPRTDRSHDLVSWTTSSWHCGGSPARRPADPPLDFQRSQPVGLAQAGGSPTIDVLLLYTPQARDEEGGTAQIEVVLQNAVDTLSTSFANSGVNAQARLVGTGLFDQFIELRNLNPFLAAIRRDPEVAALRAQTGADLVHLIVSRQEANRSACGLAYLMLAGDTARSMSPFAFGTVAANCNIPEVFAHEAGHNLGLNHDPVNTTLDDPDSELVPFRPYAFGHSFSSRWKTIMSYGGQREIPYFSNPDVLRDGEPMGIPDERDNARTLRDSVHIGAAFSDARGGGGGGGGNPPAAPTDLTLLLVDADTVELSWSDNSSDETAFVVEMRPAGGVWEAVASAPSDMTAASVSDLPAATTLDLRVRSERGRTRSQPSNVVTTTTPAASLVPETLQALAMGTSTVELTWPVEAGASGDPTDLAVDSRSPSSGWHQLAVVESSAGQFVAAGLSADTPMTFRLRDASTDLDESVRVSQSASATTHRVAPVSCDEPDAGAICLMNDRFSVSVDWRNHLQEGDSGAGTPVGIDGSDQSALFWFFDEENIELVVKILDGRAINDSFWAFFGALSDVEYWFTVRDHLNSGSRTYHNPPGELCGQADIGAFSEPLDTSRNAHAAAATLPPASPLASSLVETPGISGSCVASATTLCLQDNRFAVEVEWDAPDEPATGAGRTLPALGTSETGFFWFFDSGNVELSVKLLDGRAINDRFWFFWGGLSDVSYRVRVLDTVTGTESLYTNPAGTICGGSDIEAF